MRKPKMPPGINFPVAVAVVDDLYRDTVWIGVILVKVGSATQRRQHSRVLTVFPVGRQGRKGQMVVTGGRAGPAVLTPVPISGLLHRGEAAHDLGSQPLPFWLTKHLARQINQRGPECIMIRRSANVGRIV